VGGPRDGMWVMLSIVALAGSLLLTCLHRMTGPAGCPGTASPAARATGQSGEPFRIGEDTPGAGQISVIIEDRSRPVSRFGGR
jgi:hypothetical protein